jgi:hypothetical protein
MARHVRLRGQLGSPQKAQRGSAATEVPFRIASEQLREGSTTDEHGMTLIGLV